jgi:hypothetical protein
VAWDLSSGSGRCRNGSRVHRDHAKCADLDIQLRRIAGSHTTRCVRGDVREEIDRYCDPDLDDNVERALEELVALGPPSPRAGYRCLVRPDSQASAAAALSNTINRFFVKNGNGDPAILTSEAPKIRYLFWPYGDHVSPQKSHALSILAPGVGSPGSLPQAPPVPWLQRLSACPASPPAWSQHHCSEVHDPGRVLLQDITQLSLRECYAIGLKSLADTHRKKFVWLPLLGDKTVRIPLRQLRDDSLALKAFVPLFPGSPRSASVKPRRSPSLYRLEPSFVSRG